MALQGKVAMITGSGGEHGFGRAIARRLSSEGCDLVLTDVAPIGIKVVAAKPSGSWRGLDAVAEDVRKAGRRAITALVDFKMRGASVPIGRLATADDVAEVAAFLVSDGAEYVTGQAINVAGGSIMH